MPNNLAEAVDEAPADLITAADLMDFVCDETFDVVLPALSGALRKLVSTTSEDLSTLRALGRLVQEIAEDEGLDLRSALKVLGDEARAVAKLKKEGMRPD